MKDLDVIAVSEAYASIENTDRWEHRLLDAVSGSGAAVDMTRPDGSKTSLSHYVFDAVVPTYEPAKQAVVKAMGALKTPTE